MIIFLNFSMQRVPPLSYLLVAVLGNALVSPFLKKTCQIESTIFYVLQQCRRSLLEEYLQIDGIEWRLQLDG